MSKDCLTYALEKEPSETTPEICGNCVYYHSKTSFEGDCKYNPPVVLLNPDWDDILSAWPKVSKKESACGKFVKQWRL